MDGNVLKCTHFRGICCLSHRPEDDVGSKAPTNVGVHTKGSEKSEEEEKGKV